jgi:hypothetical protein
MGAGVLGLGRSVVTAQLKTVSGAMDLLGSVADQTKILRPVGMLLSGFGDLLNIASDAIDGAAASHRLRGVRDFGPEKQMLIYSPTVTIGRRMLRSLAISSLAAGRKIPFWVVEQECIGSCTGQLPPNAKGTESTSPKLVTTVVTATHVLQLQGNWVSDAVFSGSVDLVEGSVTALSAVTSVYLTQRGLALTRTHAMSFVKDTVLGAVDAPLQARSTHVEGLPEATMLIHSRSSANADQCFDAILNQLKRTQPRSTWSELYSPVLDITVVAAEGLPVGRHAPAVGFEITVPGAVVPQWQVEKQAKQGRGSDQSSAARYTSRTTSTSNDAPRWQESALFILSDYSRLLEKESSEISLPSSHTSSLSISLWDRNDITSDDLVACTNSVEMCSWLPTVAQLGNPPSGSSWTSSTANGEGEYGLSQPHVRLSNSVMFG